MVDSFNKEKSDFLKKKDKSKKGRIDKGIEKILNQINSKNNYYTTSSCSGRIVLLEKFSNKKNESNWLFVKHDKVKFNEIIKALSQYDKNNKKIRELPLKAGVKEVSKTSGFWDFGEFKRFSNLRHSRNSRKCKAFSIETCFGSNRLKHQIWLKQEPIILHVRCRGLKSAKRLLDASRKIFKRAGIISLSDKKIVVEIAGSERIDTIIAGKDFVADRNYIKNLIKYANRNFEGNKRKGGRFLRIVREI